MGQHDTARAALLKTTAAVAGFPLRLQAQAKTFKLGVIRLTLAGLYFVVGER